MNKVMLIAVLSFLLVGQAFGQIPSELYYDSFYEPDGNIGLVIRIYTNATGGGYLYEDSNTVTVTNGAFSTRIGDNTTYGSLSNALASGIAYLDITINGTNIPPREQILPEAYALRAAGVPDNAITASMIANDVWATNDSRYVNVTGDTIESLTVNGTVTAAAVCASSYTNPSNTVQGANSICLGGELNVITGSCAVIVGGRCNIVTADRATVGGGMGNVAGWYAVVGGGYSNFARGTAATVAGGISCAATGDYSSVGGGYVNSAFGYMSSVGGGRGNSAFDQYSSVGGGYLNSARGYYSSVGGGYGNSSFISYSSVGGGSGNIATGQCAVVAGGFGNVAGRFAGVGAGANNVADGYYCFVGGGNYNVASTGQYASVPGGKYNRALGNYSFAAGYKAYAAHAGAFVWADSSEDAFFNSAASNTFNVRARGGIFMAGPMTVQSNLAVNGYATILRVVKQGDISMGTFTNGP